MNSEKALQILEATADGSKLSPKHLHLLELAVNNYLSPKGQQAFDELHQQVITGSYDASTVYLYGAPYITKDHEGYIYYKGQHIDHFTHKIWEEEKRDAFRAFKRCQLLESKGVQINSVTYCWRVEDFLSEAEIAECEKVEDIMNLAK